MPTNVKKIETLTIQDLKKRARFELFVVLRPGIVSWYPGQKKSFCYRGDKFTDDESRMLPSLLRVLIGKMQFFKIAEIYDNDFHFQNDNRVILQIKNGVTEKNYLPAYSDMLQRIQLPGYLKK